MESAYSDLVRLSLARHHGLVEAHQLHKFSRECEDVEGWVCEKELVAANEDLGKDLEHVEMLQKRFADFVHDVLASEDRVSKVNRMTEELLEAKHSGGSHTHTLTHTHTHTHAHMHSSHSPAPTHTHTPHTYTHTHSPIQTSTPLPHTHTSTHTHTLTESTQIHERREVINQLWSDLKDLAEARTQALASAREIHIFDRDAADCRERIQVCVCVCGGVCCVCGNVWCGVMWKWWGGSCGGVGMDRVWRGVWGGVCGGVGM